MRQRWLGGALMGIVALVWARSLGGDYVWDDLDNLLYSGQLKRWSAIFESFLHDAMWSANKTQATVGTYRPLSLATFAFDLNLFGIQPIWLHLTSVLWHLAATWLLFRLFCRFIPAPAAFGVVLLWAIHPNASEAVAWINGRSEVLATVFGVAAALVATRPVDREGLSTGRLVAVGVLLLFALFGKESGVVFLPLTVWLAGEADGRAGAGPLWRRIHWPVVGAAGTALGIYLAFRHHALAGGAAAGVADNATRAAIEALPAVWLKCFQAVVFPFEIAIHHLSAWLADAGPEWWIAGGLLLLLQLVAFIGLWRRGDRVGAVGLAWWLVPLVPVALISVLGWPGLHRWLYMGTPGLFLAIFYALRGRVPTRVAWGLVALVAVGYAAQVQRAITAWGHGGRVFAAMMDEHPESSFGPLGLGAWLLEHKEYAEAERVLRISIDSPNTRMDSYEFLARAVAAQGRCEESWRVYHGWTPETASPPASFGVATCYDERGDGARALFWFARCEYQACRDARDRLTSQYTPSADPGPLPFPAGVPPSEPSGVTTAP